VNATASAATETVVVLSGGLSHERDVSLRSGRRVALALRSRGIEVVEADVDANLVALLSSLPGAVVFPVLHGEAGEDGALREVLSLLEVPFVGSVGPACRVAFDKSIATTVVAEAGIATPIQVALPHEIFRELGAQALMAALADQIGFPMMVKPSRGGSALGASKVTRIDELPSAMVGAYAYGSVAVIEEFVVGTEVTVAVADRGQGPAALPAVEIRPESGVYDYVARYTAGATRFLCPAEIDLSVAEACAALALRVHDELGLRDLSRTDLIITPDGVPTFLEVNVAPGMTETSAVPLAIEAAGWSLGKMCADLVRVAARRGDQVPDLSEAVAARAATGSDNSP
jgi:D-alanine-D-alanine ligase